jgi:hypothetical protein
MKLTRPGLGTKECCHKYVDEIFYNLPCFLITINTTIFTTCNKINFLEVHFQMKMKRKSIWINPIEIIIADGLIKMASVAPECYEDLTDPESLMKELKEAKEDVDIFTFGQRLPEVMPKFNYYMEWESIAAIPIKSFDHWLNKQIIKENRKNINKASRKGVITKAVNFDDDFVKGIYNIYNEVPIRQGRPFGHYKKNFDIIKKEHSTYIDRSEYIGAYFNEELIGFIVMFYSKACASTMQVISKIEHRDKKPTNALIAKAMEICDKKGIQYLQYGTWSEGPLGDFKRYNGFEKILIPQYYIPLTNKGKLAIKMHLHHGIADVLPDKIKNLIITLRSKWYLRKYSKIE